MFVCLFIYIYIYTFIHIFRGTWWLDVDFLALTEILPRQLLTQISPGSRGFLSPKTDGYRCLGRQVWQSLTAHFWRHHFPSSFCWGMISFHKDFFEHFSNFVLLAVSCAKRTQDFKHDQHICWTWLGQYLSLTPALSLNTFCFFFEFFACNRKWGMGDFHPCHGHFQWILCSFALCPLTKSPNLGAVSRASKFHQLLLRSSEFHSSKPDGNRFIKCSLLHFHSVINYFGKTCARNPRNDSIDPAGTLGFTGRLGVPGRTWTYLVAFECQNKAWRMCDV